MPRPKKEKPYFPPRLMMSLLRISDHGLTAICGPFGSGKTTAMLEYCARQKKKGTRHFWYSSFGETLDTSWVQICNQFSEVDPTIAGEMKQLGFPQRQNLSQIALLMQKLRCTEETVLVIDNAQLFYSDIPYELLYALSQHQARKLHIVIITQNRLNQPNVPFSAPGVLFIGVDTFLFRAEEAGAYFKLNGIELPAGELRQVMDNTLGWTAALRLQLDGYRATGVIKKEACIDQLLQATVWDTLDDQERFVLEAVAPFENVTQRQVCSLLEVETIPAYAHNLLSGGGLVYHDYERQQYVLHPLFQDFAQTHMQKLPADRRRCLLRRAARIYAESGDNFAAARCLLQAGDYAGVMELPLSNIDMADYGTKEVLSILGQILKFCPNTILTQYPATLIRIAFEFLMRGDMDAYRRACVFIDAAMRRQGPKRENAHRKLQGDYSFLRSFEHMNDASKMYELHKKALYKLGGYSETFNQQHNWSLGVPSILTLIWSGKASLAEQMNFFAEAAPIYAQISNGHGAGAVELMRAEADLHAGELERAAVLSHRAFFLAAEQCQDTVCFGALLTLGRLSILHGDSIGCQMARRDIDALARTGTEKMRHLVAGQCNALLDMALGRWEDVPAWLVDETEIRNKMYDNGICYAMRLHVLRLLITKDYRKIVGYAELMLDKARRQCSKMLMIYFLIYLACARWEMGAPGAAEELVKEAMELALPNQIYLPFAESLDILEPLYEKLRGTVIPSRIIGHIVGLGKKHRAGVVKIQRTLYGSAGKLTGREEQIALLAQKGYTNKEISSNLSISIVTVKKTLQIVYKKLTLNKRQQLSDIKL